MIWGQNLRKKRSTGGLKAWTSSENQLSCPVIISSLLAKLSFAVVNSTSDPYITENWAYFLVYHFVDQKQIVWVLMTYLFTEVTQLQKWAWWWWIMDNFCLIMDDGDIIYIYVIIQITKYIYIYIWMFPIHHKHIYLNHG